MTPLLSSFLKLYLGASSNSEWPGNALLEIYRPGPTLPGVECSILSGLLPGKSLLNPKLYLGGSNLSIVNPGSYYGPGVPLYPLGSYGNLFSNPILTLGNFYLLVKSALFGSKSLSNLLYNSYFGPVFNVFLVALPTEYSGAFL